MIDRALCRPGPDETDVASTGSRAGCGSNGTNGNLGSMNTELLVAGTIGPSAVPEINDLHT